MRHAKAVVAGLLLLAGLGAGAAACAPSGGGLGAPESPCFRSLAVAALAVHHRGRFAGVRYLTTRTLNRQLQTADRAPVGLLPPALVRHREQVCAVAYRGLFAPREVKNPWPPTVATAHLAVVVVSQQRGVVLATVLVERPPLGFARVFPAFGGTPALR